jgi:nitrite reductase (NADH) small subunit/3-phenylpropionate/trans-cinnamate dioxygenase ferredoxin subunit
MPQFQTVARVGDIPEGQGRSFAVNGTMVGVFLSEGRYLAINDFCPHMGASLADGSVVNDSVMCPWHAWRFSLRDGTWLDNSKSNIRTACYDVRVQNGEIQVAVPDAANSSATAPSGTPNRGEPDCTGPRA